MLHHYETRILIDGRFIERSFLSRHKDGRSARQKLVKIFFNDTTKKNLEGREMVLVSVDVDPAYWRNLRYAPHALTLKQKTKGTHEN